MAVVVFDPADFREAYPQFTTALLTDAQLQQAFNVACLILPNTNGSRVPYDPDNGVYVRQTMLWLLVCHLASLALWPPNQSGPMSGATEGSVGVSFALPQQLNGQYFNTTACGQTFWQLAQTYCAGGRYYAAPRCHPWG